MTKAERSRNMRWKRPAIADLNYWSMSQKLDDICGECADIHWAASDDDALINALDGDEEEAFEFKMLFTSLEAEAEELSGRFYEIFGGFDDAERCFNDFTVALIGDRFQMLGYDDYEEDYFSLTSYFSELAMTEAGKRVMRMTKKEMLSQIGQTLGIILAFHNVEHKYEYLKATFDLLQDRNTSVIQVIREIEAAYLSADKVQFKPWADETKALDKLISTLEKANDRLWVE